MEKRWPWALIAAVTLSVLLHASLLLGAFWTPRASLSINGSAPLQARLLSAPASASAPVSEAAPAPAVAVERPVSAAVAPTPVPPAPPAPSSARLDPKPKTSPRPETPVVAPPTAATSAAAPPPPDPVAQARAAGYRPGAELDPPPHPLGDIDPEYPAAAGMREGTVVLQLLIGDNGAVDEVVVISASPAGFFEASAIAAFGKAKFAPGRLLGLPVRSQLTIAVDYTPINRGGAIAGQGGSGLGR